VRVIDSLWVDHLEGLESLRESVGIRAYGQHEPLIEVLEKAYDIQAVPTLIVNEKKFEGLTKREDLLKQLCPHYKEPIQACEELKQ